MADDLLVVMPASCIHGTMTLYLHQLRKAGIDFLIMPPLETANLGGRIGRTKQVAKEFSQYRYLICSDAFDVVFFGSKAEVLGKMPDHGVMQAAEKNCWPEPLDIQGSTPWRYVNGGLSTGTPRSFLSWCDAVERHPEYDPNLIDQTFFNRQLLESSPLCVLDSRTDVFFCLHKGYEELQFRAGHPVNTLCDTRPNFIHGNGKWETGTMWARYLESLNAS
jgi:hypothetical protein